MAARRRGHGEGSVYQRRDGYWVGAVSVRCRGGHDRKDGTPCAGGERRKLRVVRRRRLDVLPALDELRRQVADGLTPDRTRTVEQYLRWWLAEVITGTVTAGTLHDYGSRVNRVIKVIGDVPLGKLNGAHVQRLANRLADTYPRAPRTQQHTLTTFRQALRWAVGSDIIGRSPAEHIASPRTRTAEIDDTLTAAEAKAVLAAAAGDEHYGAMWWLALSYGMRKGELMGLRWADVDLAGDELSVRAAKTEAGVRKLPLIAEAKRVLTEHRRAQAGRGVAPIDGRVFTRPKGQPLYHQLVDRQWNDLLGEVGVEHLCRNCGSDDACSTSVRRFHASRHTAATLLLERGVALEVVSAILGHANIGMTADIYARVRSDLKRKGLSALDDA